MTDIKVVDAICGSGKTTWIFDHIRQHPERKWVFVSPYLDEAGDGNEKGRIQRDNNTKEELGLEDTDHFTPSSAPIKDHEEVDSYFYCPICNEEVRGIDLIREH